MTEPYPHSLPSPLRTGLTGRCPRCGKGPLFSRLLIPAQSCSRCGLDYSFIDTGDGPAIFVIFIVGFIGVVGVFVTEFSFGAPLWLNLTIWLPAIVVLSLVLLRVLKGLLITQQFAQDAAEGRRADE